MGSFDLVIREAYLHGRDAVMDIAVENGTIARVGEVTGDGASEIDAKGNLVSPGLVDAHVHHDMAYSSGTGRRPAGNEEPFAKAASMRRSAAHFADATSDDVAETTREAAGAAVANGILHARSHAYIDGEAGASAVEGVLAARDDLEGLLDLQVVAFPQQGYLRDPGSVAAAREALESGADLVGGLDPGSVDRDIEAAIDVWFELAEEHDADIDAHVHDAGTLGMFTLVRFAEMAVDRGFEGRVTTSHAYALADANGDASRFPEGSLDYALDRFADADMSFVTCYMSTPAGMPIDRVRERGLTMAHGTDQVQDLWVPHGTCDVVQGALVESLKLSGGPDYRSNPGLRHLWELITTESAALLGLDGYGIDPGTPADLVVHDAPSPEWTIIRQPCRRYVVKEGHVVARDGTLTETAQSALGV